VLYDLAHKPNRWFSMSYDRISSRFEFAMNQNLHTTGYAAAKELENKRQDYEEMRLLYVGMTRARDRLVIPLYWLSRKKKETDALLQYLAAYYKIGEYDQPHPANARAVCVNSSAFDLQKMPQEMLVMDLEKSFSEQDVRQSADALAEWETARTAAVSKLQRSSRFGRASEPQHEVPDRQAHEGKSRGAAFGSFVHDVLERIELPGGADLKFVINDLRRRQKITEADAAEAEQLIRGMLASSLFTERVAKSGSLFRELPYAVTLDDVLYEGRMDLVFLEQDAAVIVDYKTDHGAPSHLSDAYSFQAGIYARALQQITGKEVREVILFHLRSNTPVPIDLRGN
jgi:ATP-dependent exoDNAse (exonuclease V) beta subunit